MHCFYAFLSNKITQPLTLFLNRKEMELHRKKGCISGVKDFSSEVYGKMKKCYVYCGRL
jgi:hypothetical protein